MKRNIWLVCAVTALLSLGLPPQGVRAATYTWDGGALPFYKGGDISMITQFEKEGLVLKEQGKPVDLIHVMMRDGCNTFRVRLFVNPNGDGGTVQDLNYVIALGQRIKQAGGLFLLDIHYSDTWASPAHQETPAAWQHLSFGELERKVEDYTLDVMVKCKAAVRPASDRRRAWREGFGRPRQDHHPCAKWR